MTLETSTEHVVGAAVPAMGAPVGVAVGSFVGDSVLAGGGLDSGELVCVSPLDAVVDGMQVRTTEVEGVSSPAPSSAPAQEAPVSGKPPPTAEPPPAGPAARLLSVEIASIEPTVVEILIDGEFAYSHFRLRDPERVAIDFHGVVKTTSRSTIPLGQGPVEQIRIGQFTLQPEPVSRIVLDLRRFSPPVIEQTPSGLTLRFGAE